MTRPVLKGRPLPEYTHLGHEAHHKLRQSMETDGWPRVPRGLEQVEDFFEQSRDAVSERWTTHVQDLVNQSCGQWLKKIPENEETQDIRELLGNPQALEDAMRIRQFDALEGLRKFAPEAWWSLLMLSSERQRAAVTVAQHWNETMDEATFKKFGVTKAEISVLLDIASRVGTYIDQAYLKQIELADAPGGSTATPMSDQPGARHFYDAYNPKTGRVEIRTYRDVFHSAWEPMLNHFNDLANRVETLVQTKRLPKSYEPLAGYLRQLAETYGSAQTNPEALFDQWQQLLRRCQEIAEAGCPIMLMPQNCSAVTGDANKVDIELRLGLRTKQTNALEKQFEPLQARALQITGRYRAALDKQIETPKVLVNYQPFAFGASLYLNPLAENSDHMVITHTNAIEDLAAEDDIPSLKKMFNLDADPKAYYNAALVAAGTHELGHTVLLNTDQVVAKRVGASNDGWILEELKAETTSVKIIHEAAQSHQSAVKPEDQFIAELGTLCSYLTGSSEAGSMGERYYFTAIAILHRLAEAGIVKQQADSFSIIDPAKGMEVITGLADEIITLYADEQTKPKDVRAYVARIKKSAASPLVKQFVKRLKS